MAKAGFRVGRGAVVVALFAAAWRLAAGGAARAADELKPGMTLDASTAAAAKGLLPPEILAHFYRTWYSGNLHAESQVDMVNPTALERRLDPVGEFKYYDGVPAAELPPNTDNFLATIKNSQATVAGIKTNPNARFLQRGPIDDTVFELQTLTQYGK